MIAINASIPKRGRKGSTEKLQVIILKSCKCRQILHSRMCLFWSVPCEWLQFVVCHVCWFYPWNILICDFCGCVWGRNWKLCSLDRILSPFSDRITLRPQEFFFTFWIFSVCFPPSWWHFYRKLFQKLCVSYEFESISFLMGQKTTSILPFCIGLSHLLYSLLF